MIPIIKIDTRQWISTAARFSGFIKKDFAAVLNREGFFIAARALKGTEKADVAKFTAELGVIRNRLKQITRGKNKGKMRRAGFIISQDSLAERIVRAAIYRHGGDQPTKGEIIPLLDKFLAARRKSVGFIASGWIQAIKAFASVAGLSPRTSGVRQFGRAKGGAKTAKPGEKPHAELWNSAATNGKTGASALSQYGIPPLQAAVNESMATMLRLIEKRAADGGRRIGINIR